LDALEELLTVPELDLVFIAPTDLSADMGLHGQIRHPAVLQKVEETALAIHKHNTRRVDAGLHPVAVGTLAVTVDDVIYWKDRNIQVLCGVAQCMFVNGAKGFMEAVQEYEERRNDT
jgi:4-hydroxy-2-oxoheptanedioate aldolase